MHALSTSRARAATRLSSASLRCPHATRLRSIHYKHWRSVSTIPSYPLSTNSPASASESSPANIPAVGLGTWRADESETATRAAIGAGYTHIDTASIYGTEEAVGKGISKAVGAGKVGGRKGIFLTTKLWNNKHRPDDVENALVESLEKLEVDYVDLFLIHWPVAFARGSNPFPKEDGSDKITTDNSITILDTWRAMESVQASGKARAIGISNFSQRETADLLEKARIPPAVHQFEIHPWLQQTSFVEWNQKQGIHVTAYSPLGNTNPVYDKGREVGVELLQEPVLLEIANKHGKTSAQVALRWGIQRGYSVIPKSVNEGRIKQNGELEFKLDEGDMEKIRGLDRKLRLNKPSEKKWGWNFFADLD